MKCLKHKITGELKKVDPVEAATTVARDSNWKYISKFDFRKEQEKREGKKS